MRNWATILILGAAMASGACSRKGKADRDDPSARQAGRAAYEASQDIKRGAKKAASELRKAGKEMREGWNEAKHDDANRPRK